MKRFWTEVTVLAEDGLHRVLLDGKPMRLPGGPALLLRSARLAAAIAAEWANAGAEISPEDLTLTRLAGTAQARVALDPTASVTALAAYAESDLLCYRAAAPPGLAERQHAAWQPWLDWAAARHGAPLLTISGILHVTQPARSLAAFRDAVAALDMFALTGLGIIVPGLGSLVLGLAMLEGALSPELAHEISVLDEIYQETLWGMDREAQARRRLVGHDIAEAMRFIALSRI